MEIKCKFAIETWYEFEQTFHRYTYIITNQTIATVDNDTEDGLVDIKLVDEQGKPLDLDRDVNGLKFTKCTVENFPAFFGKIFKYLTHLSMVNCGLNSVTSADLSAFPILRHLDLAQNKIELLTGDVFESLGKQCSDIYINISHNSLENVHPTVIDSIKHRNLIIDLRHNPVIDICAKINDGNRQKKPILLKNYLVDKYILAVKKLEKNEKTSKKKIQNLESKCEKMEADLKKAALNDDIKNYLANDNLKDFTLIVNDKQIKVHKMLLAARSSVFAEILKNNAQMEELKLIDVSEDALNEMLDFVYNDRISKDSKILMEVFMAAKTLGIKALENAIVAKLNESLVESNVLDCLFIASQTDNEDLKKKAVEKAQQILPDKKLKINFVEEKQKLQKIAELKKQRDEMTKKLLEELIDESDPESDME